MDTLRRETQLASLRARQRQLQHDLARIERQIIQAEQRMRAAEKQLATLTPPPRQAA